MLGTIKLTKNPDPDKYEYFGYGTGFDTLWNFSSWNGSGFGQNVIMSGCDMNSLVYIDNKKKDILILRKSIINGSDNTTLIEEKGCSINFTEQKKNFCLRLHYNVVNSYIFVNGAKIYKSKSKDSDINTSPFNLDNISKHFSVDNTKKTGLFGHVYDFSVNYDSIDANDILDIHK